MGSEHSSPGELLVPLTRRHSWVFLQTLKISTCSNLPLVPCNLIPLVQLGGTSEKTGRCISYGVGTLEGFIDKMIK